VGNLHDDLRGYVAGRGLATRAEAIRCIDGQPTALAAAWEMLIRSGEIVHTGAHRQVDGRMERVYAAGVVVEAPVEDRYSPRQPRDKHGRWSSGMSGAAAGGGGSGGGLDTKGAESLIQSIHESGGFTYDPRKGGLIKVGDVKGVAVAVPHTEQIVGRGANVDRKEFVQGVADVIQKHGDAMSKGAFLGGWFSEDRQAYMVELTELVPDRAKAIALGKKRNQEGVFDLGTGEYIPTGGTGG
jgi:hypothetical protein